MKRNDPQERHQIGEPTSVRLKQSDRSGARRRYRRVSLVAVPAWGVVGAAIGYLSSGRGAAAWLGTIFALFLAITLGIIYRIWARNRRTL